MRLAVLLAAAGLLGTSPLRAQSGHDVHADVPDSIAHVVDRQPAARARFAITSRDGTATLLLMDTTIVAQLTDRGLETVERTAGEKKKDDAWLASYVVAPLVRRLLDHGIAYHLRDLTDADYADGRLRLVGSRGEVFRDVSLNDEKLVESFWPDDAREFARRAREGRARLR